MYKVKWRAGVGGGGQRKLLPGKREEGRFRKDVRVWLDCYEQHEGIPPNSSRNEMQQILE